jgi:hypothetical protein
MLVRIIEGLNPENLPELNPRDRQSIGVRIFAGLLNEGLSRFKVLGI